MHPTANESAQAATTKSGQTGPRTESGKANSSRNSIRTGLYAARDFIRTGEEEEYAQTLIRLMDERKRQTKPICAGQAAWSLASRS